MEFLYIAVPFFFFSFSTKLITDSYPNTFKYDKILLISLLLSAGISYIINPEKLLSLLVFSVTLYLFYITKCFKKTWAKYLINILSFAIIIGFMFYLGFSYEKITVITAILGFVYFMLNKNKADIAFSASQIIPVGIAGLYLTVTNPAYSILFMTLFGTIRFFIENKVQKQSELMSKAFMLTTFVLLINIPNENFLVDVSLILAGMSFLIIDFISLFVFRNKKSLIQRIYNLSLFNLVGIFKALILNLAGLSFFGLVRANFLNIYIALTIVVLMAAFLYLQTWYKENEYN